MKLIIQFVKLTSLQPTQSTDKGELMAALKFIMVNFMQVNNFDEIDRDSDKIQPLTIEMVDILMNSAVYYQKKYNHEIDHMCEVFPFDDPSREQSPLKIKSNDYL